MKKLLLTCVLEYDDELMHGDDEESRDWFFSDILDTKGGLLLHSNELGDTVGRIIDVEVVGGHLIKPE
jgi:hypothetical protein